MTPHLFDPGSLALAVSWSTLQPTTPPPVPHHRDYAAESRTNNARALALALQDSRFHVTIQPEASPYVNPSPGMFLTLFAQGTYERYARAPSTNSPQQNQGRVFNLSFQFRYRARWQLGLESIPFQPAAYIFAGAAEFGQQFGNAETTQRITVKFFAQHLSNGGGAHCLFFPDTWPSLHESSCTIPSGSRSELSAQLNRETGNYSSHQWGTVFSWMMHRRGVTPYSIAVGISPEMQFVGVFGGLRRQEADVYGRGRILAFLQGEVVGPSRIWRAELGGDYRIGSDGRIPFGRFWVEAMMLWPHLDRTGVVVRLTGGADFQHAFAVDAIWQFSVGLVFRATDFPRWMSVVR